MDKRLLLALAALLGFSTACSTVKKTPKTSEPKDNQEAEKSGELHRRVMVMYGVRTPIDDSLRRMRLEDLPQVQGLDPVVEQPADDTPKGVQHSPNTSVDPVVEQPTDDTPKGVQHSPNTSVDPVVEQPADDTPKGVQHSPNTSVDPVVEKPADE